MTRNHSVDFPRNDFSNCHFQTLRELQDFDRARSTLALTSETEGSITNSLACPNVFQKHDRALLSIRLADSLFRFFPAADLVRGMHSAPRRNGPP
jgi:hypothetical protein